MIKFIEFGSNYGHTFTNAEGVVIADGEFTNDSDDTIEVILRGSDVAHVFPTIREALTFLRDM